MHVLNKIEAMTKTLKGKLSNGDTLAAIMKCNQAQHDKNAGTASLEEKVQNQNNLTVSFVQERRTKVACIFFICHFLLGRW